MEEIQLNLQKAKLNFLPVSECNSANEALELIGAQVEIYYSRGSEFISNTRTKAYRTKIRRFSAKKVKSANRSVFFRNQINSKKTRKAPE